MIKLSNVWKTYQMGTVEVHALRGLSLEIKQGEFLAIQGPSGSGKSTMVNAIGCLDVPTKGEIYLDGVNIATLGESALAQVRGKKIGFVFQTFNLLSTLTALENVMLPMIFQNIDKDERLERAGELLKSVGLGDRLTHKPGELSGGQRQRVAIARALANEPQVLLADEPTGNLDSNTGKQILEMIDELHKKRHMTVVMVTHDDNLAKKAERIAFLKDGNIVKKL
ncbi:ABC transporter ATP-binding protein [Candidatus Woesearchaeota archaeon]|nr:ABC transporter ATP-binding protein [Candidatus Woesearchaeota archaeon]HIH38988.1 ABC transporter ATP-binding protein [Candidatus Woesearchaeota archaeon]HIH48801.1 ABC transporter ATP-binding protein [Candidatus Woesearchaeota archaeon]HIJ04094.1 ABC transporter ATP-binding protein [Candidatus Woesearchaeota archaeon]